jgi:hypothetical protein
LRGRAWQHGSVFSEPFRRRENVVVAEQRDGSAAAASATATAFDASGAIVVGVIAIAHSLQREDKRRVFVAL